MGMRMDDGLHECPAPIVHRATVVSAVNHPSDQVCRIAILVNHHLWALPPAECDVLTTLKLNSGRVRGPT